MLVACAVLGGGTPARTSPPPGLALADGLALERELRGGERHSYPVSLEKGELLRVVVDQDGIDVVVELLDPDGQVASSVDSFNGTSGDEDFAALAGKTGLHRLEVKSLGDGAPPGSYTLRVEGPRPPRGRDRARVEAVEAMRAAFTDSSMERTEKALGLWRKLGEKRREAELLLFLGRQRSGQGDQEGAWKDFLRAAGIWKELGDPGLGDLTGQAQALEDAGRAARSLSRWEEARSLYEQALAVARSAGNQGQEMSLRIELGLLHTEAGDPRRALRSYEEALSLARALGDTEEETTVLNNLCDTYLYLGDWEKARGLCVEALDLSRKLGDPVKEARTLNNLGVAARRQLRLEEALSLYGQSLELARRTGDVEAQRFALNNLGFLHLRMNQVDQAFERSREALALAADSREAEIDSRHVLGNALRRRGDLAAAREELDKALAASRLQRDREREADVSLSLARVQKDGKDLAGALARTESAIEVVESLRTRVQDQNLRALFFAANQDYYEFAIGTAMALHAADPSAGHLADALQMSERARARSLLDILSGSIEETLEERRALQEDLRAGSPRYEALTQPRPLSLREIQAQVLDGQAVLLEYALGAERSYLWAVTPGSIQGFELPGRAHVEEAVSTYYRMLTARNQHLPGETQADYRSRVQKADLEVRAAAGALAGMVLAPVQELLGSGTVLIVADGALQYVPFNALPLPATGAPMVARHEVVSLPSASALAVLRREIRERGRAAKTLAVLADPVFREDDERLLQRITVPTPRATAAASLPDHRGLSLSLAQGRETGAGSAQLRRLFFSAEEARAIAALVPADQRFEALGFAASWQTATGGELGRYRLVHFATHGLVRSDHPEMSSLVLSLFDAKGKRSDGFLRLSDIYNLDLKADLVVLSACQTALGKEIRGEGLVGLTRGFMYAGAERVMASLWSVEDRATAELMKRFYRAMLVEKLRPAAALRQAQLEMAKSNRWSAPYYWAGFSLQGEWK